MRWEIREEWDGLPEWEENPRVVTALQWRQREGPRGEDWWGDWTDIPTADHRIVTKPQTAGDA